MYSLSTTANIRSIGAIDNAATAIVNETSQKRVHT